MMEIFYLTLFFIVTFSEGERFKSYFASRYKCRRKILIYIIMHTHQFSMTQNLLLIPLGSCGGATYTRWGRTTCPDATGTELVYRGRVVGSSYREAGSSNYLCLSKNPQSLQITYGIQQYRGRLYGTQYYTYDHPPAFSNLARYLAPCSVCRSSVRTSSITIPGSIHCPQTWTKEYYGYLMGEQYDRSHHSRAPICVDLNAESDGSGYSYYQGYQDFSALYFIETACSGIECPPNNYGGELACVVCTK